MERHAYSTLVLKAVDDDQRIIEGLASSPTVDHDGDILEPDGAEFSMPMPLLFLHRQDEPIGKVLSAKVSKDGIRIRAQIAKNVSARIDEVWNLIKGDLCRGLSIGSRLVEFSRIQATGGLRVTKWKWLETSVVTIPANQQASISVVKSLDAPHLVLPGTGAKRSHKSAGASAKVNGHAMSLNVSEQLQTARTALTEKSARLSELFAQAGTEDGLTTEDAQERDTLAGEIKDLAKSVDTLQALEQANAITARPVTSVVKTTTTSQKAEVKVVELEKGIRFARVAMAIAAGKGSVSDTLEYAKRWKSQTPEVFDYVKAMVTKAVEGMSVLESPGWGSQLVYQNNVAGELIELLRARTVMDRISGFRQGVFNTRMAIQTGGSTVNWVGEGAVKPVTELEFGEVTLPYHKIAGIVVLTQELVRLSNPNAERVVRDDLVAQIARFKDAQFLSVSVTASANNPASVTNGVSSPAASGTDADALYLDLNTALATFDNVENSENLVILMTPALARGISTLRNSLGTMEFPGLTAMGGTLLGYRVIVSSSVPSGHIIIINPSDILVADDGTVSLDASNQATLDMAGGSSPNVNLWQRNLIGIRAELPCTWKKVRAESVAIIDTATYGPTGS
jgi:HK97 family phage major capsid protein/HK97 family phage prohead protease